MGKGTKRKGGGQREDKERPTSGEEKWGMREERMGALSDLYVYQTRHPDCSGWLSERFRHRAFLRAQRALIEHLEKTPFMSELQTYCVWLNM